MPISRRVYIWSYLHRDVASISLNLENINQLSKKDVTTLIGINSKSKSGYRPKG